MLKQLTYRFRDGKTNLSGAELNARFFDIDARLHGLEMVRISWQAAVDEVTNHGLARINEVVKPTLDAAEAVVAELNDELAQIRADWSDISTAWALIEPRVTAAEARLDAVEADLATANAALSDRLDMVEAGLVSLNNALPLAAQASAPTPGDDEGVLYTADDGGDTCLYYKAGGKVLELARPGQAPAPGYITGLTLSRASDTGITIQPGGCEISGKLYVLESAVTITVSVTAGLYWRGIQISSLPTTGNVLSASNFSHCAGTNIVRSSDGTYWHYDGYSSQRVIGLYPAADSAILSSFWITDSGEYYCYREMVNVSSPPTSGGTNYNVGLPVLAEGQMTGHFICGVTAGSSATRILVYSNGIYVLQGAGRYCAGEITIITDDGLEELFVSVTGDDPTSLVLRLLRVNIPTGMAR